MKFKRISAILLFITIFFFIAFGAMMIGFSHFDFEKTNYFFGSVLIATTIPPIVLFIAEDGLKKPFKIPYLILGIILIIIGIVFICAPNIGVSDMCVIWGVHSLVLVVFTIADCINELKNNKFEILEIIICLADVIFSILLIVRTDEAVDTHLIFVGISFLLKSLVYSLEYFFIFRYLE